MKNIKKITLLFCLISTITFAKSEEGGIRFFESSNSEKDAFQTAAVDPADPDPGADPTPINNYLPLLVIGAGLVALRYRKQLLKN